MISLRIVLCLLLPLVCGVPEQNSVNSEDEKNEVNHLNDIRVTPSPAKAPRKQEHLVCPDSDTPVPLFTLPCERNSDCSLLGPGLVCCERKNIRFKRCLKGTPAPKPEPPHSPWLRIFPRKCPETPIAEFREIKNCTTDEDCAPRICCPERGGGENYCRTAALHLDNFPSIKRMVEPITSLVGYFQCTPAPPAIFDIFPRECRSAFDCFPNLCCQEQGRRVCRPPRQSIISFVTDASRTLVSSASQWIVSSANPNNNGS